MAEEAKPTIKVETLVKAPVAKVWDYWTVPAHITQWNNASEDWHSPRAENDVRTGGVFNIRMEAKDGSFGFDFGGIYTEVKLHQLITYTIGDGRSVTVLFTPKGNDTKIEETFEAEGTNPIEMQQAGWQSIMDNFKKYVETH